MAKNVHYIWLYLIKELFRTFSVIIFTDWTVWQSTFVMEQRHCYIYNKLGRGSYCYQRPARWGVSTWWLGKWTRKERSSLPLALGWSRRWAKNWVIQLFKDTTDLDGRCRVSKFLNLFVILATYADHHINVTNQIFYKLTF